MFIGWVAGIEVTKEEIEDVFKETGFALVPIEPTQDMQVAGLQALVLEIEKRLKPFDERDDQFACGWRTGSVSRSSMETDACYKAMLEAAEEG